MSCSQHKIRLGAPLRHAERIQPNDLRVTETRLREARAESFREGFEAGQKSMGEQLMQQRAQLLELQRGVFQSLSQALPHVMDKSEEGLVQLALDCSRKIIAGLPIPAELVEAVVREALRELQGITQYTVRLHPEDLLMLQEIQSSTLPAPEQNEVRMIPDSAVERGGCLVDTPFGTVDANRSTKFQRLESVVQ